MLRRLAPPAEAEVLVGDLEEAHRARSERRGALIAAILSSLETLDIMWMIARRKLRLPKMAMSWLDLKLALRMLVRYPVLSVIGTVSLALGVALGAAAFAIISMTLWPSLPLPDGDRIVSVQLHDEASNENERRLTADFLRWRAGTATLTDVGAGWDEERNLTMGDGTTAPVYTASVTASTFALARVTPVIGRLLSDEDARPAAPPVIVIGQKLWRERFAADPAILDRPLMFGETQVSVVGVLPEAFRFPRVAEVWEPLHLDESALPRTGTRFGVWARLRPGETLESAASDLEVLARRAAIDWPATHTRLKAEVRPYAQSLSRMDTGDRLGYGVINVVIVLLIAVVCGNVALLMFARAATRESEIIVRSALGAGRGRLIAQFLTESLVLSALALGVGLALAQGALRYGFELFIATSNSGRPLSFWFQPVLPPVSIVYAVGLAIFAALITGVLPGMKITRGLASRLRESTAGAGGLKFGGVWTVLIVAQVALTMAVPVMLYFVRASQARIQVTDIGVPTTEYLAAELWRDARMTRAQFAQDVRAVREALPSIPGVSHATVADSLPLIAHWRFTVHVDEGGAAPPNTEDGYNVAMAAVEADFFDHFAITPIAGRLFSASDYAGPARVAVVNQLFVDQVLGGLNPIGRRVKTARDAPWLEIVGLVRNVSMGWPGQGRKEGLYIPLNLSLDLRRLDRVMVSARVPGAGPGGLSAQASALRAAAAKVDPLLRVTDVNSLADEIAISVGEHGIFVKILSVVSGWVMLLALSGIYAVMSFTVSRRTREIGIRMALGSSRAGVVLAILRRPIAQIVAGVIFGTIAGLAFKAFVSDGKFAGIPLGLSVYLAVIVALCVLASVVPVRRALKVDPIAALRND
jgi:putative ABC transport system permease protein